jgi:hypothetical protein
MMEGGDRIVCLCTKKKLNMFVMSRDRVWRLSRDRVWLAAVHTVYP